MKQKLSALFKKKRTFAVLFVLILLLLFYRSDWLGQWLYPLHYKQDIRISAANYEVDPFLIAAIIRVESNFKPDKQSKKGAIGLMQLMPDTAKWIVGMHVNQRSETVRSMENPDVNIEAGAWYLNWLYNQFNRYIADLQPLDQLTVIAAAYNAGPGNVKKWLESGTWDGTNRSINNIPFGETRHYIQRVVYYYKKYTSVYEDGMPE